MGLDQYLYAKKFTSANKPFNDGTYDAVIKALDIKSDSSLDFNKHAIISIGVGYWRKANAIHQWFVNNCQDGEDDCRESSVSRKDLEELRQLCKDVLADNSRADELLPSCAGFFFGSTEYDEWYFGSLQDTINIIDKVLEMPDDGWDFTYQSSW